MALTTSVQRILVIATGLGLLMGCASPTTGPPTAGTVETTATELGHWVASCTSESIDAERMLNDLRSNAPELVHMKSPDFGASMARADQLLRPLDVCNANYIGSLARELPRTWQTSGAENFARLLIGRVLHSTAAPPRENASPSNDGCPTCTVVGTLNFAHPKWGEVRLETYVKRHESVGPAEEAGYRVINRTGSVLFNKRNDTKNSIVYNLNVLPTVSDGFIFISYNTGRYDGIIAIRATADGIIEFGSDPFSIDFFSRFWNAKIDQDSNGTIAIIQTLNNCIPSCGNGTNVHTRFTYDSNVDDFVPQG